MSNIPYIALTVGSRVVLGREVKGTRRANPQRSTPCTKEHTLAQGSIATIESVIERERNIFASPGVVVPANIRILTIDDFSYRLQTDLSNTGITCGHYEAVGDKLNVYHGGLGSGSVHHNTLSAVPNAPSNATRSTHFPINAVAYLMSPIKYWQGTTLRTLPAGTAVCVASAPMTRITSQRSTTTLLQTQNSYYSIQLAEWRTHSILWKSYHDEPARFLTTAP